MNGVGLIDACLQESYLTRVLCLSSRRMIMPQTQCAMNIVKLSSFKRGFCFVFNWHRNQLYDAIQTAVSYSTIISQQLAL